MRRLPIPHPWSLRWPHDQVAQQRLIFWVYLLLSAMGIVLFTLNPHPLTSPTWLPLVSLWLLALAGWGHGRWGWSLRWLTHFLLLAGFVLIGSAVLNTGGMSSPSLLWLIMLPLASVFLLGVAAAWWWTAAALLGMAALTVLTAWGWFDARFSYGPDYTAWGLSSILGITVSVMAMNLVSYGMYQHQLAQINKRNEELSETRAALLQAESYKDQFLASVGHELRTPMNAILGFNDVLRAELPPHLASTTTVDLVHESTEHLLKLVNQILSFSQIQADRMPLQMTATYMPEAFQQCVLNFARPADSAVQFVAELDPQLPDWIFTDAQRLKDVLCHLIDNAFKFTAAGTVTMRVRQDPPWLLFEVEDTGVGIAPEIQTHIFNRFEHASAESHTQFGGTGLGLAISKGLVALFGGEMGLRSVPGHGALFWFRIPLQLCAAPPDARLPSAHTEMPSILRLLLVDDNPVNLKVATLLCQSIWPQAQLHATHSGREALKMLQTTPVDLVLLDLVMPDLDGLQVAHIIRTELAAPLNQLPIVGLTASSHPNDHAACRAAGMNAVVLKPINKLHLENAVLSALQQAGVAHV